MSPRSIQRVAAREPDVPYRQKREENAGADDPNAFALVDLLPELCKRVHRCRPAPPQERELGPQGQHGEGHHEATAGSSGDVQGILQAIRVVEPEAAAQVALDRHAHPARHQIGVHARDGQCDCPAFGVLQHVRDLLVHQHRERGQRVICVALARDDDALGFVHGARLGLLIGTSAVPSSLRRVAWSRIKVTPAGVFIEVDCFAAVVLLAKILAILGRSDLPEICQLSRSTILVLVRLARRVGVVRYPNRAAQQAEHDNPLDAPSQHKHLDHRDACNPRAIDLQRSPHVFRQETPDAPRRLPCIRPHWLEVNFRLFRI
mmetsp:Transcript_47277/g.132021  ORF Transcript_47277/g.132021 Transcript_47277/m.132021 type:complete len:318 (-) Transcript_47277:132-1085(-)